MTPITRYDIDRAIMALTAELCKHRIELRRLEGAIPPEQVTQFRDLLRHDEARIARFMEFQEQLPTVPGQEGHA